MADHDVFACECHETCSWCEQPVLDRTLRDWLDGARICRVCWADARALVYAND